MENFDLEKMAFDRAVERGWHPDSLATRRVANEIIEAVKFGFNAHGELTKDKLFTVDDLRKAIDMARTLKEGSNEFEVENILGSSDGTYGIKQKYSENQIIESLLSKT